jgi:hypothetical protein
MMTLNEILQDILALEEKLRTFERQYGVLSETFYQSYMAGEEPEDDAWVLDWAAWAGAYEVYLRQRKQYRHAIESLQTQAVKLSEIIKRTAHRESIPVVAAV